MLTFNAENMVQLRVLVVGRDYIFESVDSIIRGILIQVESRFRIAISNALLFFIYLSKSSSKTVSLLYGDEL